MDGCSRISFLFFLIFKIVFFRSFLCNSFLWWKISRFKKPLVVFCFLSSVSSTLVRVNHQNNNILLQNSNFHSGIEFLRKTIGFCVVHDTHTQIKPSNVMHKFCFCFDRRLLLHLLTLKLMLFTFSDLNIDSLYSEICKTSKGQVDN